MKYMHLAKERIKIAISSKMYIGVVVLVSSMTVFLILSLYSSAIDGYKIPIGVTLVEHSMFKEALENSEKLQVYFLTEDEGKKRIKQGEIEVYFVEKEKKESSMGAEEPLFLSYYLEDNTFVPVVFDVVMAEIADKVAYELSFEMFQTMLKKEQLQLEEDVYIKAFEKAKVHDQGYYVKNIEENKKGSFEKNNVEMEKMIISVVLTFSGFVILFSGVFLIEEKAWKIDQRLRGIGVSKWKYMKIDILHVFLVSAIHMIVVSAVLYKVTGESKQWIIVPLYYIMFSVVTVFLTKIFTEVKYYGVVVVTLLLMEGLLNGSVVMLSEKNIGVQIIMNMTPLQSFLKVYFNEIVIRDFMFFVVKYVIIVIMMSFIVVYWKDKRREGNI